MTDLTKMSLRGVVDLHAHCARTNQSDAESSAELERRQKMLEAAESLDAACREVWATMEFADARPEQTLMALKIHVMRTVTAAIADYSRASGKPYRLDVHGNPVAAP